MTRRPGDEHRYAGPPVGAFASVLGFCSVGLLWRLAQEALHVPFPIGEPLLGLGLAVFIILAVLFAAKIVRRPNVVRSELTSAASSSLFGCIPISLVLFAAAALPYSRLAAAVIWSVGASTQIAICLYVVGRWIGAETAMIHASPTWLIPIAGNSTAAFIGAPLGFHEISWAFLSFGLVSWLALLPILLSRLIFHPQLPGSAAPSLAIFVSAPAVTALAWSALDPGGEIGFRFFLFAALLFAALPLRHGMSLARAKFTTGLWAYTFPSGALAICLIRYSQLVQSPWATAMAWLGLAGASAVFLLVAGNSARALLSRRATATAKTMATPQQSRSKQDL
jgi:tellurite resistance protein